jgi:hypothetical protein
VLAALKRLKQTCTHVLLLPELRVRKRTLEAAGAAALLYAWRGYLARRKLAADRVRLIERDVPAGAWCWRKLPPARALLCESCVLPYRPAEGRESGLAP